MKTIVQIKWDKPEDQGWLCDSNIEIALSAYCTNTKFVVKSMDTEINQMQDTLNTIIGKEKS
jgi:hypothetical protein